MTDDLLISGSTVDAEGDPRLALRPEPPVSPYLDGAWWPRSTNLATELPGLAASLSHRLGQVNLVGYHDDAWTDTPEQVEIAGRTVELQGFTSDEPNSVVLVGKAHHIALLVIPPGAGEQVARQEMAAASQRADGGAPADQAVVTELAATLARREGSSNDPQRVDQITRWCQDAAQRFVDAPVQVFVPILIENIVCEQMDLHRATATS
jgi:hypothetical protein